MALADGRDRPSVRDFYAGRSVLVTGATGFVGKVLVEKLLRSCPAVKVVYVLLRPKREQSVQARLLDLLRLPLFDRLRESRPEDLGKIVPVAGDVAEPGLGLKPSDEELLLEEVSVVFHSAATVRFNEELQLAVQTNLVGTKEVAELCRKMHKLQALIHVSTIYCNRQQNELREEVYPPPYDPEKAIRMIDAMKDELRKTLSARILSYVRQENTYIFTKAMAESLLASNYSDLPFDIVRPSIVTASVKEPIPGWVDGDSGATLILSLEDKGVLRVFPSDSQHVTDFIPVDMTANFIICVPWRRVICPPKVSPLVYNICSGRQNPITYGEFFKASSEAMRKHSSPYSVYPEMFLRPNRVMYNIFASALETLPAYALDSCAALLGGKPRNVHNDIAKRNVISLFWYFVTQEWNCIDENVTNLMNLLSAGDQRTFFFDVKEIRWFHYLENFVLGIRRFIYKERNNIQQKHEHIKRRKESQNAAEESGILVRHFQKLDSKL